MSESNVYFLDACALIALVKQESGAEVVEDLLVKALNDKKFIIQINKINLLEVYYGFHRERGKAFADEILRKIKDSAVGITDTIYAVLAEAGRLKSIYRRISLADAVALAEASIAEGTIVTADHHEMDTIEQSEPGIQFLWIR
ncbi:MAG: PIN domain-containing protein [Oscillospiraceae bacterium]|jgi:PIN domain nuclease of toxin-antitoxin system|nr:PIN domain-containing protein [Oscillospiraceae bacterium]